jgi:PAS domain S-box-containing protein
MCRDHGQRRGTGRVIAPIVAAIAATVAVRTGAADIRHATPNAAPVSATGIGWFDVVADGGSDWSWIAVLMVLAGGVIAAYVRIFAFWRQSNVAEGKQDRNHTIFQLATIGLLFAICGYAMSMLMFVWPSYRLLAVLLLALNACNWACCFSIRPLQQAFSSGRLERQLRDSVESRARELEAEVRARTQEANRLAEIARRTANAVIITDRRGRVEWVNEGFTRITGFTSAEIVGRKPGELLQGPLSDPHEIARIRAAIARGESVAAELINYHKEGRTYIIRIEIEPLRDEDGELNGFMAVESDVTEQRTSERKIHEQSERLATLVHNLPGVAFRVACDEQWTNLFVSDAIERLTGYPASDFINNAVRDCASITHPDDIAAVEAAVSAAIEKRSNYNVEYRIIHKSGQIRWVNERASVIFDGDRPLYIDGAQYDITELRDAREAASAASQSKSEFLANMSHEIRTPMTAILGFADLLAESAARTSDAQTIEHVDIIRRNGQHLLAIINDILDLSKIEAGKMTVESVDLAPRHLIEDAIQALAGRAAEKGIALRADIDPKLPAAIRSDPLRMRQVLLNLIGNAIKFTHTGSVTVSVSVAPGPLLRCEISDTGVGMAPEAVSRLFRPLEQADSYMTPRFGGTGLGLCISKRLAQMLGGDIEVSSELGRGSRFVATFVLVEGADSLAAIVVPSADHATSLRDARVLLAEDGPDNVRLICHVLRRAGAFVTAVGNGEEMLGALTVDGDPASALRSHHGFDLIITDIQMPVMDGFEAVRQFRARGGETPIIALTAHAMSGDREKCIAAGCDAYATKPIDRNALVAACHRLLGNARKHQAPDAAA